MANYEEALAAAKEKIHQHGYSASFTNSFERLFHLLVENKSSHIRERDVEPLTKIPDFKGVDENFELMTDSEKESLDQTAIIKLNGGLGTTMGLNQAKSLLKVKDDLTFLDIIVNSVFVARKRSNARLPLIFMNSFRTSSDTKEFLKKFGKINEGTASEDAINMEILQHSEPKLLESTLEPVSYPKNEELEWCPPGHGDFYCSLYDSGVLHQLIEHGYKFAFVSNADNLGARVNPKISDHFAKSGVAIMLELADKTEADVKGGHIVVEKSTKKLILREVAQIHEDDLSVAFDILVHPYFNTNSIWLNLVELEKTMQKNDGVVELPLIKNVKNVDPTDKESPKVIQIETAIGAGINAFEKASAINVSRNRFRPVKSNSDLEILRSDAFYVDESYSLIESGK